MKSASEIIENYLREVYETSRDAKEEFDKAAEALKKAQGKKRGAAQRRLDAIRKQLVQQVSSIEIPQAALALRASFTTAAQETVKDLRAVAQFIEEQDESLRGEGGHLEALRANAADLQAEHDKIVYENLYESSYTDPGGDNPSWYPAGYSGIAYARRNLLDDCLRWMALHQPEAAAKLRESLVHLTAVAEKMDAPLHAEGTLTFADVISSHPSWERAFKYHILKKHFKETGLSEIRKAACRASGIDESKAGSMDNYMTKDGYSAFQKFFINHENGPNASQIIAHAKQSNGGPMV